MQDWPQWSFPLANVDTVIHTAARVHILRDDALDPVESYRRLNIDSTMALAEQSAQAGVRRFIFISSVKVNGESTSIDTAFHADDPASPEDLYARSKYEMEQLLLQLAERSSMEVVIIRPPLIYGPGVKANFLKMMKWLDTGIPLPLAKVHNERSLVGLDNLIDFIDVCIWHQQAANQIFLVSDGVDFSTPQLLRRLARLMQRRLILLPVPESILSATATLLGQKDAYERLCNSLKVDIGKNRDLLGWQPRCDVDEMLGKTVAYYRSLTK